MITTTFFLLQGALAAGALLLFIFKVLMLAGVPLLAFILMKMFQRGKDIPDGMPIL